eukprot:332546-Lingulodinium_polyedra.AAC.1
MGFDASFASAKNLRKRARDGHFRKRAKASPVIVAAQFFDVGTRELTPRAQDRSPGRVRPAQRAQS